MTLNLNDGSYRPYRKPNEETNYIHVNPDPSPPTIKEIPGLIEKILSVLSSSSYILYEATIKCSHSKYKQKRYK